MAEENKIRLTKEGTQDRMVTQSQLQPFLDRGFTQVEDTTPIQPVQAPTDPAQLKAFNFAQQKPQPMTPETLAEATSTTLPDIGTGVDVAPPTDTSGTLSATEQVKADIELQNKIAEETKTAEQKQAEGFSSELIKEIGQLGDETAFEADVRAEKTNELNQQLNSLTSQIDALNAQKEVFKIDQQGKPITLSSITGSVAQNNAKLNGEILTLTAQGNAILGKLALAEKQIEAAVNAEFAPRKHKINILSAQLKVLVDSGQLAKAEKVQADALNRFYTNQAQDLADEKAQATADKTNILNTLAKAIDLGVKDQATLDNISNAKTPEEALVFLGQNVPASATGDFQFVSGTDNQAGGVFDKNAGIFTPFSPTDTENVSQGVVSTGGGNYYDIGTYATDPNHEASVQNILNNMGQMTSVEDMDAYIQSVAPGSPITGQMVANSSAKTGTDWEIQIAMMQQDSSLGTAGIGARNFNPGNIAQFDSLGTTPTAGYNSWQEGVNAVGDNLSRRQTTALVEQALDPEVGGFIQQINNGEITLNQALNEIDEDKKYDLIVNLGEKEVDEGIKESTIMKSEDVLKLQEHKGLNSSVGPNITKFFSRFKYGPDALGERQDFIGSIDQLVSDLSLEALIQAKSRGATFGALSDTEMQILRTAATKIGTWIERKDDKLDGEIEGFDISQKRFKEELASISEVLLNGQDANRFTTEDGTIWKKLPDGNVEKIGTRWEDKY